MGADEHAERWKCASGVDLKAIAALQYGDDLVTGFQLQFGGPDLTF
jgi:hypothetical protein